MITYICKEHNGSTILKEANFIDRSHMELFFYADYLRKGITPINGWYTLIESKFKRFENKQELIKYLSL